MAPSDIINIVLKDFIFPLLKEEMFSRKGTNVWKKNKDNNIDCISLEKSQRNSKDRARPTMDLGVYWPEVEAIRGRPYEAFPTVPLATIRCRIEDLVPSPSPLWWTAYPDTDPELLGCQVIDEIKLYGIPWLAKGHDIQFVHKYLMGKNFKDKVEAVEKYIQKNEHYN